MMAEFRAFRIHNDNGVIRSGFERIGLDDLAPGDVVIRAVYSNVNYKDALASTGRGSILKRFPLVGGIDVAGVVETSSVPRFDPGDAVL
ncbi:MAG: alcohol dehydrogenase catalytic domain-containing protein, partial [Pseudomonadota bacterium]